jgi:hypothetical protein
MISHYQIEKDQERQESVDGRYELIRENLGEEVGEALAILDNCYSRVPRHTSYKERLEVFALRLTELSEIADRLAGEFNE